MVPRLPKTHIEVHAGRNEDWDRMYLQVREQPDIGRNLVRRGAEACQGRQDIDVNFARVGLGRNRIGVAETREFGDQRIQFLDFVMVAIEKGKEAGLRARGALNATEAEVIPGPFDIPQVPQELLVTSKISVNTYRNAGSRQAAAPVSRA
jgi:hypothetical protein